MSLAPLVRVLLLSAGLVGVVCVAAPAGVQASGGCNEYQEYISNTGSFHHSASHGVQLTMTPETNTLTTVCSGAEAGGSAGFHPAAVATGAKIGWAQTTVGFRMWTEWEVNGTILSCGGNSCYYPICVAAWTPVDFRVVYVGSGQWNLDFNCGAGLKKKTTTPNLGVTGGIVVGQEYHFGGSTTTNQFWDSAIYKTKDDVWLSWSAGGAPVCDTYTRPWDDAWTEYASDYNNFVVEPGSGFGVCP